MSLEFSPVAVAFLTKTAIRCPAAHGASQSLVNSCFFSYMILRRETKKMHQGSFLSLTSYPELTLHKWAKAFGPLYSFWLGDTLFAIISDPQIAKDLMVTNGAVCSSRKEMFIKSQTIFATRGITATPYVSPTCGNSY